MPNERSQTDHQTMAGHFNVKMHLHCVICITNLCQRPSNYFSLIPFYSGHFSVNDCSTITEILAIRFHETLHVYLWVGGGGVIEEFLTFTDDLDLSRSQACKITFWAIYRIEMYKVLLR